MAAARFLEPASDLRLRARSCVRQGLALQRQNRLAEAAARYGEALALDGDCFDALQLTAVIRFRSGDLEGGISLFERALRLHPDHEPTLNNLGNALRAAGRLQEAIRSYRQAIAAQPRPHLTTLQNLAQTLFQSGDPEAAFEVYCTVCALDPSLPAARSGRAGIALTLARWDFLERDVAALATAGPLAGPTFDPGPLLLLPLSPAALRRHAERYAASLETEAPVVGASRSPPRSRDRPLRVAYLSGDFREHAVGYLMGAVLELHERCRVEPHCYGWGAWGPSAARERIVRASQRFRDVTALTDLEVAAALRSDGIDVAVDLMGYTMGARTGILAARPAPVQVSWLGYPGTMGGRFTDYLIADEFIVPAGREPGYTESVVRLPDTYLPYDRTRLVAAPRPRAEYGLPDEALVLACFGPVQKINPAVFGIWMEVLRRVPGAVLWLANLSRIARDNLRREAAKRGVAAERLIFAEPLAQNADHLARYHHVDLALDTFPYGSHSTAADALWVGAPLVALVGGSFAARVSGSVLTAGGLPELITQDLEGYRDLILELAGDAARRQALRERLEQGRSRCALFDTPRFVRALEDAYESMARSPVGG